MPVRSVFYGVEVMASASRPRPLPMAVLLLAVAVQAITPDADDLASPMAIRLIGVLVGEAVGTPDDDDSSDGMGVLVGLEFKSSVRKLRGIGRAGLATGRRAGALLAADLHRRPIVPSAVSSSWVSDPLQPVRLNC
jgi:hypothetical protein